MSKNPKIHRITIENKGLEYKLTIKDVKNINIRIKSTGEVLVSASKRVSQKRIDKFLINKSDFIFKHISKFTEKNKNLDCPKEYNSGEIFFLLGEKLSLNVIESKEETVFIDGLNLNLVIRDKNNFNRKEKLIKKFYDEKCKEYFDSIAFKTHGMCKKYNLPYPTIKMRTMSSRWGSCMVSKRQITLNKKLIEAPLSAIEYVVLHEFIHFVHPNHSKRFYDAVSEIMPDWKERKKLLQK